MVDNSIQPPILVYNGRIQQITGGPEGDCATLTFAGIAFGQWDPFHSMIEFTGLAASNLLSCDVKNKAPAVGDPCEVWDVPQGPGNPFKRFLILKTHQIPFKDCG